ncbi:efflux RND transporter periplasmic adaptor subunit [Anaerobacillus sp. CMMVII]|uniref:efflux RND transporter periplasmic adaptor subunit n=1 Tax=Anaerobacillus sp. CMMVII TaxID=2755588 RepID=UPI0021B7F13D|nr:efflux RND transporter periplasmic adaptor subunit [Anaerobacillus sp. CMMVII]MCT8140395.1 efflux RND transporter periplasmic adaptor subunit [Anaerobacillus sp. CMMVII]
MKRFGLAFASIFLLFACSTKDITSETTTGQQIPVDLASVQEINLEQKLEIPGQALPNAIIPLFTTTPFNVIEVNKKVGDKVFAGEQILRLDDEIVQRQASQAQKAVSELEKGITAAKQLQKNVDSEYAEIQKLQRELEASLDKSRQLISSLTDEAEDINLLLIIQQSLETSLKQAELTQAAGKIGSLPQINVAELEIQLEVAKQNSRQAQMAVEATTLTSPINGTIAELNVTENQIAPPNSALATVVNLNPIIATFHVNSYQVVQLAENMKATLVIEGLQNEIKSKIQVVSPTINPQTNLFKVEIPIENDGERIKGGMRVIAYIDLGGIEKANVIPTESILYDENSPYVFIVKDGIAKRQDITLGIRSGNVIEVHEGITLGDQVVTRGKERLTDGVEITVRNED